LADDPAALPSAPRFLNVPVSYIKSASFRVIYADGAYGGVTPRGVIHFAFYNERHPIPRGTKIEVAENDLVIREVVTETREGVVREIETSVMMQLQPAKEFYAWLGERISQLEKLLQTHEKPNVNPSS